MVLGTEIKVSIIGLNPDDLGTVVLVLVVGLDGGDLLEGDFLCWLFVDLFLDKTVKVSFCQHHPPLFPLF